MIVETGAGLRGANSYATVAYVTAYLTDRNRLTENNWSTVGTTVQEAALIAATDYIEKRYRKQFMGQPLTHIESENAMASAVFAGNPTNGQALVLGDETYTFVSVLGKGKREVLIGASTAQNLTDKINQTSRHATAELDGSTVVLTAKAPGTNGELTGFSGTLANVTLNAFSGAVEGGLQPLSFPRKYLYDALGKEIEGVPDRLRQATAEYAVRAANTTLLADPTTDATGGQIKMKREKVGPIEEEIEYVSGTVGRLIFSPFPAADRLLQDYLLAPYRVTHG